MDFWAKNRSVCPAMWRRSLVAFPRSEIAHEKATAQPHPPRQPPSSISIWIPMPISMPILVSMCLASKFQTPKSQPIPRHPSGLKIRAPRCLPLLPLRLRVFACPLFFPLASCCSPKPITLPLHLGTPPLPIPQEPQLTRSPRRGRQARRTHCTRQSSCPYPHIIRSHSYHSTRIPSGTGSASALNEPFSCPEHTALTMS